MVVTGGKSQLLVVLNFMDNRVVIIVVNGSVMIDWYVVKF